MKSLLSGLLIFSMVQIANASSTELIKAAREKVVELHTTRVETSVVATKKQKNQTETTVRRSVCAGAFVSPTGDILTARHCVEGATSIDVIAGGREYRVVVRSVSKIHDLALIHIDSFNTPHFVLAKSLEQGQTIYALGSPLGITGSLSTGIVAKLNGDVNYIDCGILPGNSGGPVINTQGEMVGVATACFIVLLGTTHLNIIQSLEAIIGFALYGN